VTTQFAVSWDYLCPFARNAHEHVMAGLEAGADWDVEFRPFSLGQAHVEEGEEAVFDRPDGATYLHALAAGVTVRDHFPHQFLAFHQAMFSARHDQSRDIKDPNVVAEVVESQGLNPSEVAAHYEESVEKIRQSHAAAVADSAMFGVPTFVVGDRAVFVRLMDRPGEDPSRGRKTIEGVLALFRDLPTLNEFKQTQIAR